MHERVKKFIKMCNKFNMKNELYQRTMLGVERTKKRNKKL